MAFKDENGRITIDEIAAERDVLQLYKSKQALEDALNLVKQIKIEVSEFSGITGETILDSSNHIQAQIDELISETETTIESIKQVVSKYQAIDADIKSKIEAFNN